MAETAVTETRSRRLKEGERSRIAKRVKEAAVPWITQCISREMAWKWVLAAALIMNTFVFYAQMKMEIYYGFLSACTAIFLCLFYFGFRNRWIPFGIHAVLSVLMFSDVVYNSYFNGYLSLNMMGSAQYVGDVTDIISQLIQPHFFLLFLWIPIAAAAIYMDRRNGLPKKRNDKAGTAVFIRSIKKAAGKADRSGQIYAGEAEAGREGRAGRFTGEMKEGRAERAALDFSRSLAKETALAFSAWRGSREIAAIVLLSLLIANPANTVFFQSVGNLEFFSYHLKDVGEVCFGLEGDNYETTAEADYRPNPSDPLFAAAKGKNLIVIQVEGLQNFVIGKEYNGKEITPVLNKLVKDDTVYFDHYYMQIGAGNTSDAEFTTNNSLYGTNKAYTYEIYKDKAFRGLPWLLMEKGYSTIAMHGYEGDFWSRNTAYPGQGFQTFVDASGYTLEGVETPWGINDTEFFKQSAEYLKQMKRPFYSFLITLSSHTPFQLPEGLNQYSNITIKKEHEKTRFGNYLNSVSYVDYALGEFFEELKKAGLYDKSIIAIYGDHYGLAIGDDKNEKLMEEFLGKPYQFDSMANIPLIVHIPGAPKRTSLPKTISVAGGQLDFLPTIAYLMGFESLDTLYLGNNMLDEKDGLVIQDRYAPPGSFLTNTIAYMGIGDGVFETGHGWEIRTGKKIPRDSEMKRYWNHAVGLLNLSANYLKNDTIRELYYPDGKPTKVNMIMPKAGESLAPARATQSPAEKPKETTKSAVTSDGGVKPGSGGDTRQTQSPSEKRTQEQPKSQTGPQNQTQKPADGTGAGNGGGTEEPPAQNGGTGGSPAQNGDAANSTSAPKTDVTSPGAANNS